MGRVSIAPIEPIDQPEFAGPVSSQRSVPLAMELLFAVIAALAVAALGAPIGLLWSKIAPHVELVQTDYGPYPVDGEPEGYWADDGWFIIMAIIMGALVAVAAWLLLRRYRGPVMLAGLVVGSAGASVLGAWIGNKIGYAHYLDLAQNAPNGAHIFRPVKLRTGTSSLVFGFIPWVRGTMLVQSVAAAAVYTGLAGFHVSPTLRYETMPAEYLDPEPEPVPVPEPEPVVQHPQPYLDSQPYPPVDQDPEHLPSPNGRHAPDPAAGHPPAHDPDQR
jgi:hypothetical protein